MNNRESDSSSLIDQLSGGFRAAQVLFAANRLQLFSVLGQSEMHLQELAKKLGATVRGVRILCDALVALGVLQKQNNAYRNGPEALAHLVPNCADPKIAQLHHGARLYDRWRGLYDVVIAGGPASEDLVDPRLPGGKREFALAMADSARTSARLTAQLLDLTEARTLLDLGGGPGVFAIEFAKRNPGLRVTLMDDAETLEVAKTNIYQASLADRILLRAGDGFETDLGGPYDVVFVSNLVHIFSSEKNRILVSRCASALNTGGRLVLKDFLLTPSRTSPAWSALFAVNMLVATEGGDCYTLSDMQDWFETAGLLFKETIEVTGQSFLVVAQKQ